MELPEERVKSETYLAEFQTLIMTAVSNYCTELWEIQYYANKLQLHFMTAYTIFIFFKSPNPFLYGKIILLQYLELT